MSDSVIKYEIVFWSIRLGGIFLILVNTGGRFRYRVFANVVFRTANCEYPVSGRSLLYALIQLINILFHC